MKMIDRQCRPLANYLLILLTIVSACHGQEVWPCPDVLADTCLYCNINRLCEKCKIGYYKFDDKCFNCMPGCFDCDTYEACATCM